LAERQEAAEDGRVWAYPAWRDVFEFDLRGGPKRLELKQTQNYGILVIALTQLKSRRIISIQSWFGDVGRRKASLIKTF
jgi:hypothetical protein